MITQQDQNALKRIIETISQFTHDDERLEQKKALIIAGVDSILGNGFDEYGVICTYCVERILPVLISHVYQDDSERELEFTFNCVLKFVREKFVRTGQISSTEYATLSYYETHTAVLSEYELKNKFLITYFDIYSINSFREEYDRKRSVLDDMFSQYTSTLEGWEAKVNSLAKELKGQRTDLNYLNLSKAFTGMLTQKKDELAENVTSLKWLGGLAVVAPVLLLIANLIWPMAGQQQEFTSGALAQHYVSRVGPIVVVEALVIYYFKIILQQYYSLKSQILQVQFRNSLCSFIEGHSDFKKEHKDIDFSLFDKLIYSPIVQSSDKVPAAFDGFDQILKLIKEIKR